MSGSGLLGPHNNGPPPPPPRCRVYFYAWTCGHRELVYCSDCDVEGPPSSHLDHPHQERQLPAPRHRCPICGQHPPHELARGPLLGENLSELARQSIASIRRESNEPAIIRARVAQDVAAVLDPWSEPAVTDDVTTGALQTMVGLSILQDREGVMDDQQFSRDLLEGRDRTPRATTAEILQRLPPTPNGVAQPQADWWANGPVQPAPLHHGGHGVSGYPAHQWQPNGVYTGRPPHHHGGNGGHGFMGRGRVQREQPSRGPRGSRSPRGGRGRGRGRAQHGPQPRQPSQLRNGYAPQPDGSDGQQQPEDARH